MSQGRQEYLVTYRADNGKLDQIEVAANSPTDAFMQLIRRKPLATNNLDDIKIEIYRSMSVLGHKERKRLPPPARTGGKVFTGSGKGKNSRGH